MIYKLEIIDNYLVATPDDGTAVIEVPTKDVRFRNYADTIYFDSAYDATVRVTSLWTDLRDASNNPFASLNAVLEFLRQNTGLTHVFVDNESLGVDISRNDLSHDAWGRLKVYQDNSLFHGMFTYNVPVTTWYETVNDVIQASFVNATSVNGALNVVAGPTLDDKTNLKTYRNPRYEPNRGMLYSTACILPNPNANQIRRWGTATDEAGVFFELDSGNLYAVVRTTVDSTTTDDRYLIDTSDFDLSKGNVYDIQYQWRGVGNYRFFINLKEVVNTGYLGTLTELSMFNPALPLMFENENKGDNNAIVVGCVDVTSEGGQNNGKTYGSVSVTNNDGSIGVSGYNVPVIAIRSKPTVNGLINTRDTLALLASAYSNQKSIFRVWATRDFTAITENDQSWQDYGDGHLEFIEYNNPSVASPMTFDESKSTLVFSCRVDQDNTYSTSALFEGRTDIYLTPAEMFVFTMHKEQGGAADVGVTFEFAEAI